MIDVRRETAHIYREFERFHDNIGESLYWLKFDLDSEYHPVYDETGRSYQEALLVPILWVDQIEAPEAYSPEGRRQTQRLRFAISAEALRQCGVDTTEAHAGRIWDDPHASKPWADDRLNDLLYYDGRFYEVSNFQIRGRAKLDDVIVGVSGIETHTYDDRVWDSLPIGA